MGQAHGNEVGRGGDRRRGPEVLMRLEGRGTIRRFTGSVALALAFAGSFAAGMAVAGNSRAADAPCAGPAVGVSEAAPARAAIGPVGAIRPDLPLAGRGPAAVRLAGVILPSRTSAAVRVALSDVLAGLAGASVEVRGATPALDRRNRLTGHVVAGGRWLQRELLSAGLVVFDGSEDACARELAAAEDEARRSGRGIWGGATAAGADDGGRGLPDFVVIEARVKTIGKAGRTTYLNFGSDYRRDLTVVIPGRTLAGFPPEKEPSLLAGRLVRVRGWARPVAGIELNASGPAAVDLVAEPVVGDRGTKRR